MDSMIAVAHRVQFKTIVSTTLPTISSQFGASQLEYTWVGVSYMLTQTAFQPLYGKLSDLIGRKVCVPGSLDSLRHNLIVFIIAGSVHEYADICCWLNALRRGAG